MRDSIVYNQEFRHRVIDIMWISEWGTISAWSVREFKTSEGAEAYAEKLAKQGKQVLTQHGQLRWLTEDDIEKLDHTEFGPVNMIPDRREDHSHELPGYATDPEGTEHGITHLAQGNHREG